MKIVFCIFALIVLICPLSLIAQDNETCMMCHEDNELTGFNKAGEEISAFVDLERYDNSVHAGMECINCHTDLDGFDDFPHEEELQPVDCSVCHDDVLEKHEKSIHNQKAQCYDCHGNHYIVTPGDSDVGSGGVDCGKCHKRVSDEYDKSLHGKIVHSGAPLAPRCWDCHGSHDILDIKSPDARVNRFNIPFMCGSCHKEGTEVTQKYDIPEDSILFHYSQSIHGVGLYTQGLIVTAVCIDCHTAHNVRDHADPESSINRNNIANTCKQCHGQIEKVHRKVINGELWQKEPNKVPVCVDCHSPHKIRNVFYEEGMADKECLKCHSNKNLTMTRNGEIISLYVDSIDTHDSMHRGTTCAQCHTGATPGHERPCETVINRVDCSICHSEVIVDYNISTHGTLHNRGDKDAPYCSDCHGKHNVKGKLDTSSPTFPTNVPKLCGRCHTSGGSVDKRVADTSGIYFADAYKMSIHGKGLLESGLVVTAMCTDCHTAHKELPKDNPNSTVNPENISKTCAKCHNGIYEKFVNSIHSPIVSDSKEPLPNCSDCHHSHKITRTDTDSFESDILLQCGGCHEDVTESYFETFHGKVSKLGYGAAARCHNCHGAHDILPPSDPNSSLSRQNIVKTCGQCHTGSHRQFAGYLTHATHHDRTKYPILYYTFWFMTILLVSTLIIAGTHTLLWMPRSFQAMRQHKKLRKEVHGRLEFQRFKPLQSWLHVMVVVSFLGLALTGMTLKFSYLGWAQWISAFLGGFESAGYIHRMCAIITFAYFGIHLYDLINSARKSNKSLKEFLASQRSMIPSKTDLHELIGTLKWFLGMGPRPRYGRWTYWEKFDYFAVFWGVAIIGSTGLMLWFPEFFTHFLPGWIINVATIIHSDEALLATGFIFTVHFFNTHFRPDKFPMDTVIFTGRIPVKELQQDRPREYEELMENKKIKKHLVEPLPAVIIKIIRVFGTLALTTGLIIILLIIYAEVFGYR
ncbi:MAG: hypothetical protein ABIJ12_10235 [bacterium]